MALALTDLITPATAAQWTTTILGYCASLGLNTTAWQSGGVTRTILAVTANCLALVDSAVSKYAAGGYLDFAAATTVTPEYGPGFLDGISQSVFSVTRNPSVAASGTITFTNSSASSYGPYAAGTFHVADPSTGAIYTNTAALTIAASTTTDAAFRADVSGGTSGAAAITAMVISLVGVTCTNASAFVGTLAETNAALVVRCKAKLATFAARTGGASAYQYFATATSETGYPLVVPITRALPVADKISGSVVVYLAREASSPSTPDVTAMQTYLQSVCTPDDTTMTCAAATTTTATWHVTYYGQVGLSAAIQSAYVAFINTLPIGGSATENGTTGVPLNAAEDYVARAVPTIRTQLTTDLAGGGAVSLALAATSIAVAATTDVTVAYGGL